MWTEKQGKNTQNIPSFLAFCRFFFFHPTRLLKIHPRALEQLNNLPRGIRTRRIFLKDGKPIKEFQRDYKKAVGLAKLGDFTFHNLRHCSINNLRLAGNDYFKIMAQSGHKTMAVFKRYNMITEAELEQTKWLDEKKTASSAYHSNK